MGSSDPTSREGRAGRDRVSYHRMYWPAIAALSLALSVKAQDFTENRRRAYVDEDTSDYVYDDYELGNSLDRDTLQAVPLSPLDPPPRARPPPKRNQNPYNFKNDLRRPQKGGPAPSGPDGCRSRAKNVAHESQCDLYYECFGDQGFIQTCPNGLMYNGGGAFGLLGPCDYPHNVNCYDREGRNPPQSTEHCDWLYGIFGHETSCTRYWTCWNGTATEQFCIGGLLYNEETHACDWPQNVAGCQKHPLRKDDANGNVPLGKSCNRYWACQGGSPRLQRCPAMLVFDKDRRRCVTPPTEDCDVPATTPAPEDEQGGQESSGPPQRSRGNPSQNPENRRRFQTQDGGNFQTPNERPLPLNQENLPFKLPSGAQPLN